jgi:hypothetical protein
MDRHGGVPLGELTPGPDGAVDAEETSATGLLAVFAIVLVVIVVLGWLGATVGQALAAGCGGG